MTRDDDRLEWLEDKDAIRELAVNYCYRVAENDIEGIVALFCDDCFMEVLGHKYEGKDGLRKLYTAALGSEPKPFIHNHVVEKLEPGLARGMCAVEIKRGAKYEPGGAGRYEDRYRKQNGEWKLVSRVFLAY